MALATYLANSGANCQLDALGALCNLGTIRLYTAPRPLQNDPATGTLCATLSFPDPAFGASVGGVITANTIPPDTSAAASGTVVWFRVATKLSTPLWDGSIGTSNSNLVMNSNVISSGAQVSITSFTHTLPLTGS